jgi:hypothetical protein
MSFRRASFALAAVAVACVACARILALDDVAYERFPDAAPSFDAPATEGSPEDARVDVGATRDGGDAGDAMRPPTCTIRGFDDAGAFCDDFDDLAGKLGPWWNVVRYSDASVVEVVVREDAPSMPNVLRTTLEARPSPGSAHVELIRDVTAVDCTVAVHPETVGVFGPWVFEVQLLVGDGGSYRVVVYASSRYTVFEVQPDASESLMGGGDAGPASGFTTLRIVTRPDGGRTRLYRDGVLVLTGQVAPPGWRAFVRLGVLSPYAGGDDGGKAFFDDVRCTFR